MLVSCAMFLLLSSGRPLTDFSTHLFTFHLYTANIGNYSCQDHLLLKRKRKKGVTDQERFNICLEIGTFLVRHRQSVATFSLPFLQSILPLFTILIFLRLLKKMKWVSGSSPGHFLPPSKECRFLPGRFLFSSFVPRSPMNWKRRGRWSSRKTILSLCLCRCPPPPARLLQPAPRLTRERPENNCCDALG